MPQLWWRTNVKYTGMTEKRPITLLELRDRLTEILDEHGNTDRANNMYPAVVTADGGMGPTSCSLIIGAVAGFDWNNGKVLICTQDQLNKKK